MTLPLYQCNDTPALGSEGNRGLWYTRFFDRYLNDWSLPKDDEGKKDWVVTNAKMTGDSQMLQAQALRQLRLVAALGGQTAVYSSEWHFATGLGLPHPVENGLTWHPTLGIPYLAGSGVKGLTRAWVEVWDESLDEAARKARLRDWFGSDDPQKPEDFRTGRFIFFDAIPTEPVRLAADVMTPHMDKWYEQGQDIRKPSAEPKRVPADWHDPVPVPFLVTRNTHLLFSIAPRRPEYADELPLVLEALESALAWLGAGAKTAAGYGRMERNQTATANLESALDNARRQAEMAALSPEQQELIRLREAFDVARAVHRRDPGGALHQETLRLLQQGQSWPMPYRTELADLVETIFAYLGWTKKMKEKKPLIEKLRSNAKEQP